MMAAIFMTLQNEEQMMEMCYYIAGHREAMEWELLDKAREIRERSDAEGQEEQEDEG